MAALPRSDAAVEHPDLSSSKGIEGGGGGGGIGSPCLSDGECEEGHCLFENSDIGICIPL